MRKHELITGPSGSGKSQTARRRIEADIAAEKTQAWVIDYHGTAHVALVEDVTRYAAGPDGAKSALFEVLGHAYLRAERLAGLDIYEFHAGARRHGFDLIALTIDSAEDLLQSQECARALARLLQMARKTGVVVRLVTSDVHALRNSAIRHAMNTAEVVRCGQDEPVSA